MRVAVTGATGNVGINVLGSLSAHSDVDEIIGIARHTPEIPFSKVTWKQANVVEDDLHSLFAGVDAVVHLAWALRPSHQREALRNTNINGARRVFQAAAESKVKAVIITSSLAAYSPGPNAEPVDESWPTNGIRSSNYSIDKVEIERMVDLFEVAYPNVRWVRMRPTLVVRREVGPEMHDLFVGKALPAVRFRGGKLPLSPKINGLAFQAVHGSDVGNAFAAAVVTDVKGAFNLASEPVIDAESLAELLEARAIPVPKRLARTAIDFSWRLRIQPTEPGWFDVILQSPLLDSSRAERDLGWEPQIDGATALKQAIVGIGDREGFATPALNATSTKD